MSDKKYLVTEEDMRDLVTLEVMAYGFNKRQLDPYEVPKLQIPKWATEYWKDLEELNNEIYEDCIGAGMSEEQLDLYDKWINENRNVNVLLIVEAYLNPLTRPFVEITDD